MKGGAETYAGWVRYYEDADQRRRLGYQDPLFVYWQRRHKRDRRLGMVLAGIELLVLAAAYWVVSRH
jgi:type II secretory pathway component PulM